MVVWDMLAVLVIGVLSGMGIGSGGLLVLYLSLLHGTPQLQAQGLNLLFFIFASAASLCIHLLRRRIPALPIVLLISAGLMGSLLGTRIVVALPEGVVAKLFGVFLIAAGLLTLLRGGRRKNDFTK